MLCYAAPQVTFIADRFRLGDERFDADFQFDMNATLKHKPAPKGDGRGGLQAMAVHGAGNSCGTLLSYHGVLCG